MWSLPTSRHSMFHHRAVVTALLLLVGLGLLPDGSGGIAYAQADRLTTTVTVGFDGYVRPNAWLPLFVDVSNDGVAIDGEIQVDVRDTSGDGRYARYAVPLDLPSGSRKRVALSVYLPERAGSLDVRLVDGSGRVWLERSVGSLQRVLPDELFYVVVSDGYVPLEFLETVGGRFRAARVAFIPAEQLPEDAAALAAVDLAVLAATDTTAFTSAQHGALRTWLSGGGQLVVTGGVDSNQRVAGIADLLPVTVTGVASVDALDALAAYAGEPIAQDGPFLLSQSRLTAGDALVLQDGNPLLARRAVGAGAVTFLALDPAGAPLLDWSGSTVLWRDMALNVPVPLLWEGGAWNEDALVNGLERLPLRLPSVWSVALFLVAYVVLVGPLNYIFLWRRRRREWLWGTIPLLVIIFTMVAFATGFRLRGRQVVAHQLAVSLQPAVGESRMVQAGIGLYSPRRTSIAPTIDREWLVRPAAASRPGTGVPELAPVIERGAATVLPDLALAVGEVRPFVATAQQPAIPIDGSVTITEAGNDVTVAWQLSNGGDEPLLNATLLYNGGVFALGDLPAGESVAGSQTVVRTRFGTYSGIVSIGADELESAYPALLGDGYLPGTFGPEVQPEAVSRFQLLNAVSTPSFARPSTPGRDTVAGAIDRATLAGWTRDAPLTVTLAGRNGGRGAVRNFGETVHFIELDVNRSLSAAGGDVVVPLAQMTWRVVDSSSGTYPTDSVEDLFLGPDEYLTYQFVPAGYATLVPRQMTLWFEAQPYTVLERRPMVLLWDRVARSWVPVGDAPWDEAFTFELPPSAVTDSGAVEIRITNNAAVGELSIRSMAPSMRLEADR